MPCSSFSWQLRASPLYDDLEETQPMGRAARLSFTSSLVLPLIPCLLGTKKGMKPVERVRHDGA